MPLLSLPNDSKQFSLDTAIVNNHYATALVIVKAGGKTNHECAKNRVLALLSDDPVVDELKTLLLKDKDIQ